MRATSTVTTHHVALIDPLLTTCAVRQPLPESHFKPLWEKDPRLLAGFVSSVLTRLPGGFTKHEQGSWSALWRNHLGTGTIAVTDTGSCVMHPVSDDATVLAANSYRNLNEWMVRAQKSMLSGESPKTTIPSMSFPDAEGFFPCSIPDASQDAIETFVSSMRIPWNKVHDDEDERTKNTIPVVTDIRRMTITTQDNRICVTSPSLAEAIVFRVKDGQVTGCRIQPVSDPIDAPSIVGLWSCDMPSATSTIAPMIHERPEWANRGIPLTPDEIATELELRAKDMDAEQSLIDRARPLGTAAPGDMGALIAMLEATPDATGCCYGQWSLARQPYLTKDPRPIKHHATTDAVVAHRFTTPDNPMVVGMITTHGDRIIESVLLMPVNPTEEFIAQAIAEERIVTPVRVHMPTDEKTPYIRLSTIMDTPSMDHVDGDHIILKTTLGLHTMGTITGDVTYACYHDGSIRCVPSSISTGLILAANHDVNDTTPVSIQPIIAAASFTGYGPDHPNPVLHGRSMQDHWNAAITTTPPIIPLAEGDPIQRNGSRMVPWNATTLGRFVAKLQNADPSEVTHIGNDMAVLDGLDVNIKVFSCRDTTIIMATDDRNMMILGTVPPDRLTSRPTASITAVAPHAASMPRIDETSDDPVLPPSGRNPSCQPPHGAIYDFMIEHDESDPHGRDVVVMISNAASAARRAGYWDDQSSESDPNLHAAFNAFMNDITDGTYIGETSESCWGPSGGSGAFATNKNHRDMQAFIQYLRRHPSFSEVTS
jgi:hypothetical protein